MKKVFCFILAFILLVLGIVPAKAAESNTGVSYFTYNEWNINLREVGSQELICMIPAGSWIYIYDVYSEDPSRSVMQYQGQDGHALNGGCQKQYLPHRRDYHWAIAQYGINLRDDEGNLLAYIPAGSTVEVYGDYTLETGRSVLRWNGLQGHALNGGLKRTSNSTSSGSSSSSNSSVSPSEPTNQGLSEFKLAKAEEYDATIQLVVASLQNTRGEEIEEIPTGAKVHVYGTWAGDQERLVVYWNGLYGTVKAKWIKKASPGETSANTSAPTNQGLSEFKLAKAEEYEATIQLVVASLQNTNGVEIAEIPEGDKVHVHGTWASNQERLVVHWNGLYGTVKAKWIKRDSGSAQDLEAFEMKVAEEYEAIVQTYALAFNDTNGERIGVIPVGAKVRVYGIWSGDTRRAVVKWDGRHGTVKIKWLYRVSEPYNKPEGFAYTEQGYWAVVGAYDLDIWDQYQNDLPEDVPAYSLVWVYGKYTDPTRNGTSRVVVNWYGQIGTIRSDWLKKAGQGDVEIFTDIDHQRVSVVKDGKLIAQGPCQSGQKGVYDTEPGVYRVAYKSGTAYFSRWDITVNYCVSFDGDVCFHTSPSSEFEADSYISNGSHGCVRLIEWLAEIVYNNCRAGTTVYVASLYYPN